MIIDDVTDSYVEHVLVDNNLNEYEKEFPELFQHYFTFWAQKNYWHKELNKEQVLEQKNLIVSRLPILENKHF